MNGSDSRSSSLTSSGARPSSSSLIELWWISFSLARLFSSSGAALTSSSSCLIMLPIRMTLAGCSTISVTGRSARLIVLRISRHGYAVWTHHQDLRVILRFRVAHSPSLSLPVRGMRQGSGWQQQDFTRGSPAAITRCACAACDGERHHGRPPRALERCAAGIQRRPERRWGIRPRLARRAPTDDPDPAEALFDDGPADAEPYGSWFGWDTDGYRQPPFSAEDQAYPPELESPPEPGYPAEPGYPGEARLPR